MHRRYVGIAVGALGVVVVVGILATLRTQLPQFSRQSETGAAKNTHYLLPLAGDALDRIGQLLNGNKTDDSSVPAVHPANEHVALIWFSDFDGDRIGAFDAESGKIVWSQQMGSPPIPPASYATNTEYVTVAPNGNLIVADGDGMMVQEIDRATHKLLWQYGVKDKQGYADGLLHQPDKSFKINDHEVVINDGNNRRVIIVDQNTNKIVWQYGETLTMGSKPGFLRGNTSVRPIHDGQQFLITDTLDKRVILVDRATKNILQEWRVPDAKWIEHAWYTDTGTLIMEDRQKDEVFELDGNGQRLWTLTTLADGSSLHYPADTAKLANGDILIAEAGRGEIIEVNPSTGEIMHTYKGAGFVTTLAIDSQGI